MLNKLLNVNIVVKIIAILVLFTTLFLGVTLFHFLPTFERELLADRKDGLKNIVEVSLSLIKEEAAEVMEVALPESACVVGQRIAEAGFPKGLLIGTIVRGEEVIVPDGDTVLKADDHLIIFAIACFRLDRFFACRDN